MRQLPDVLDALGYHPATPETAPVFAEIRQAVSTCAERLWPLLPDGPDKTVAMRSLVRVMQDACFALAMSTPVDRDTPAVARVLPSEPGAHGASFTDRA